MPARNLNINQELPHPFILSRPEGFYLTGTDSVKGESDKFDLFFSQDLANWNKQEKILILPDYSGSDKGSFRAPEIVPIRNKFCLYYTADSNGDPEHCFVRAAVSELLKGPYHDIGILTDSPSFHGHAFSNADGSSYLIYSGNEGSSFKGKLAIEKFTNPNRLDGSPLILFPEESNEWEEVGFTYKYKESILLFSNIKSGSDNEMRVSIASKNNLSFKRIMNGNIPFNPRQGSAKSLKHGPISIFRTANREPYICCHLWDDIKKGMFPCIAPLRFKNDMPIIELAGNEASD